jgi:hypothetical protein
MRFSFYAQAPENAREPVYVDIATRDGIGGTHGTRLPDRAAEFRKHPNAVRTDYYGLVFTSSARMA